MVLILDLDDTIYSTGQLKTNIFARALSSLRDGLGLQNPEEERALKIDLWNFPFDHIIEKYNPSKSVINDFKIKLEEADMTSLIPFIDYSRIQNIGIQKILVTTGITCLQEAKIKALGISTDFKQIYIDDPLLSPRKTKELIFKEVLKESACSPKECIVIGDNPDSEISVGLKLGMTCIQRKSDTKSRHPNTHLYLKNFEGLSLKLLSDLIKSQS